MLQPLHLLHVFPNFGTGGPEVRTTSMIDALGDDFRHTVVALNNNFEACRRIKVGISVNVAPLPARRTTSDVRSVILRERPDLVLTYGWGGTDVLLSTKLRDRYPVIHTEDGFLPDESDQQLVRRLWYRRAAFRLADRLIVPSHTLFNIARRNWWISQERIKYVPNGIDVSRFKSRNPDSRSGRDAVVIGTVSGLRPEKNLGLLIRSASPLLQKGDVRLVIVGDGPEREMLQRLADSLGVQNRVEFVGHVDDPVPYLYSMDVFALTSDTEQMPISILEAMAAGLPIVATDVGDNAEMVSEQNRTWMVPPRNEARLTSVLTAAVNDDVTRRRFGTDNQTKCFREFTVGQMVAAYRSLYLELIMSHSTLLQLRAH